jgi:hypothetical protein
MAEDTLRTARILPFRVREAAKPESSAGDITYRMRPEVRQLLRRAAGGTAKPADKSET